MAGPCYLHQVESFDFTQDEIRDLWAYSKENYIDRGVGFEDTIKGVSGDLGLHPKWVAEAFTKPKTMRNITSEIYRSQDLRKEAVNGAKAYVRNIDTPGVVKLFKGLWALPRSALTFGHYAVFPVTHGSDLMFRPTAWHAYFKGAVATWKFASRAVHGQAMAALEREPLYAMARRGGLDVKPSSGPVGILSSRLGGMSQRGWSGLKITRMELFKQRWNKLHPEEQTLDTAKHISEIINHSTGTMSPGERGLGVVEKAMFAPKLTESKWMRAVVDPIKTVGTFSKMAIKAATGKGDVTPGERVAAYTRFRNAAEFAAFYTGMLAVNQGFLTASGSPQKVNFTDYKKGDWLRMKGFGHVLNTRGALEVFQLLGKLVGITSATSQELRGKSEREAAIQTIGRYAQYKIDPTIQTIGEAATGEDVFGRPLPFSEKEGTEKRPKYTWTEYALQKGPIPLGGATREIYDTFRENGMSALDATTLLRGIAIGAFEGIGGGTYPDPDVKE